MVASHYAGSGTYIQVGSPGGEVVTSPDASQFQVEYLWSSAMRTPGTLYDLSQQGVLFPPYGLNYAYLAGTSMACPQVAGAAALYYGKYRFSQNVGYANMRCYRAIARGAQGVLGAPNGTWENNMGYGELDVTEMLLNHNARGATIGSIDGIVYYNSTALANVAVKAVLGGTTFSTTTQRDGTYRFDQLPPGIASLTAVPFGALKTRKAVVEAGCDTPGVDFWAGTYTGDDSPPTIVRLYASGVHSATRITVVTWGYDAQTGIDKIMMQIGTTPGGQDVLSNREVVTDTGVIPFAANIPLGHTYYLTSTYTNGAGLTTTKQTTLTW
jgi:subtilisin family serine protease